MEDLELVLHIAGRQAKTVWEVREQTAVLALVREPVKHRLDLQVRRVQCASDPVDGLLRLLLKGVDEVVPALDVEGRIGIREVGKARKQLDPVDEVLRVPEPEQSLHLLGVHCVAPAALLDEIRDLAEEFVTTC